MTTREQLIEAMARAICEEDGYEPEFLEPGDAFGIDVHIRGEPCHYIWRQWTERAVAALTAIEAAGLAIVPVDATEAMIDAGHTLDPLGCDIAPNEAPMIYKRIYRAMIEAGKIW